MTQPVKLLTVVAPIFNEESNIAEFYGRVKKTVLDAGCALEFLFVDDGSSDRSPDLLRALAQTDPQVRVLTFSRNFGHQLAVKAGIDHAQGDAVVILDADLQDPPEMISDLLSKMAEGYDVVYAVRVKRDGETLFKKWTAALYYKLLRSISSVDIPVNTGDFRIISRRMADVIKSIHEQGPYLRGLISWAGFRQTGIPMHRHPRFAGTTKYSLKKMLQLAWGGILHFSILPLQLSGYFGGLLLAIFACLLGGTLWQWVAMGQGPQISAVILLAICFVGGLQLLGLSLIGLYLGRTYDQVRGRPLYILKNE